MIKTINGLQSGTRYRTLLKPRKAAVLGTYFCSAVRAVGKLAIKTKAGTVEGIVAKYCSLLQRTDDYNPTIGGSASYPLKQVVSALFFDEITT